MAAADGGNQDDGGLAVEIVDYSTGRLAFASASPRQGAILNTARRKGRVLNTVPRRGNIVTESPREGTILNAARRGQIVELTA